jgi:hypothetical protein
VIELYAITGHPAPPLPPVVPLEAVAADGLEAVCAPAAEGDVSPEALWRHEGIVEALMEDRDVLPVRYGTRVEDEAAVLRVLEERRSDLLGALDRVRGAVELSVRVRSAADDAPRSTEVWARVHEPLSRLARSSVRHPPRAPSESLRASYLVDRDRVQEFVHEVSRLESANPALSLLCTGPWPPYSFAER